MSAFPSCPVCGFVWRGPGRTPAMHQQIEFPMMPSETHEQAERRLSADAARIRERAPWCRGKIERPKSTTE